MSHAEDVWVNLPLLTGRPRRCAIVHLDHDVLDRTGFPFEGMSPDLVKRVLDFVEREAGPIMAPHEVLDPLSAATYAEMALQGPEREAKARRDLGTGFMRRLNEKADREGKPQPYPDGASIPDPA